MLAGWIYHHKTLSINENETLNVMWAKCSDYALYYKVYAPIIKSFSDSRWHTLWTLWLLGLVWLVFVLLCQESGATFGRHCFTRQVALFSWVQMTFKKKKEKKMADVILVTEGSATPTLAAKYFYLLGSSWLVSFDPSRLGPWMVGSAAGSSNGCIVRQASNIKLYSYTKLLTLRCALCTSSWTYPLTVAASRKFASLQI